MFCAMEQETALGAPFPGLRLSPNRAAFFREAVREWWMHNRLSFPWRSYTDPFHVLLAETLLRKTNAEKVARFLPEMLAALQTPKAVASMSCEQLAEILKPLGIHRQRAQLLKSLATQLLVRHGGAVPTSLRELEALPGVGPYTARAVLCFAFGRRTAVVDRNVIRVIERFFNLTWTRRPHEDPNAWKVAEQLLPEIGWAEHNYALLDLGKKVCRPRRPRCSNCPLVQECWFAKSAGLSPQPR